VDGFPRAIERTVRNLREPLDVAAGRPGGGTGYWVALAVLGALTLLVLGAFVGSLTAMVDFATIVSFLTAPILGYLNLRAVQSPDVAPEHRLILRLVLLSWVGLILLAGTAGVFLVSVVR
jgi:Mn2+/Fe2+ NRAMP family transporter